MPKPNATNHEEARASSAMKQRLPFLITAFVLALSITIWMAWKDDDILDKLEFVDGRFLNRTLLEIPSNQWIEIYPSHPNQSGFASLFSGVDWYRQGHAGIAFDSDRGTLLIFGSNSHGENWDNSVHEFSPLSLDWIEHLPPSPEKSYKSNDAGVPVAGENGSSPWAMHTYDNIAYVPELDALVISSIIDHTPAPTESAKQAKVNPTWIYDLEHKQWSMLLQDNHPFFFASGSSYDPDTSSLWAFKPNQLWRLDTKSRRWQRIPGKHDTDLSIHFTMVTDTKRHQFLFFGNDNKSNSIWVYTPAAIPENEGHWEQRQPVGDSCPKDKHFPVAFDRDQGVFVLTPDANNEKSQTLVYSPDDNRYIRVNGADLPAHGMNYMMEFDPYHRLFYLVTGGWPDKTKVLAFRLDLKALMQREQIPANN